MWMMHDTPVWSVTFTASILKFSNHWVECHFFQSVIAYYMGALQNTYIHYTSVTVDWTQITFKFITSAWHMFGDIQNTPDVECCHCWFCHGHTDGQTYATDYYNNDYKTTKALIWELLILINLNQNHFSFLFLLQCLLTNAKQYSGIQ